MAKSYLKLLGFYVASIILLSPLYSIVVFLAIMSTDSGDDRAFLPFLSIGFLFITSVPFFIGLLLFKELRKKQKFLFFIGIISSIFLFVYVITTSNAPFIKGILLAAIGFIFSNLNILLVLLFAIIIMGVVLFVMKGFKLK